MRFLGEAIKLRAAAYQGNRIALCWLGAKMYSTQSPHADLFKLQTLGVSQTDVPTGQLLRVNAAFCTLLGYREQELIALTNKAIMHPEDWQGE